MSKFVSLGAIVSTVALIHDGGVHGLAPPFPLLRWGPFINGFSPLHNRGILSSLCLCAKRAGAPRYHSGSMSFLTHLSRYGDNAPVLQAGCLNAPELQYGSEGKTPS